jgi:hypothetical protein
MFYYTSANTLFRIPTGKASGEQEAAKEDIANNVHPNIGYRQCTTIDQSTTKTFLWTTAETKYDKKLKQGSICIRSK